MKRFLSVFFYLVLALFPFPWVSLAADLTNLAPPTPVLSTPPNVPRIFIPHPKFDFGTVDVGPNITHKFKIYNKGKSPLEFTVAGTGGGDHYGPFKTELKPGGSTFINAVYRTAGHIGKIDKIIYVTSNDPVHPTLKLQVSMNMVPEVEVWPNQVWMPDVKHGQSHPVTVKVLGKVGVPLRVLSAGSANHLVTITSLVPLNDDQQDRTGATLVVDVPVTQAIGSFSDTVNLRTDDPKKRDVTVLVTGEVVGKVRWDRKVLYFQAHQQEPVTVTFTADDPKNFVIRGVESAEHLVRPSIVRSHVAGLDRYLLVAQVVKNVPKDSDGKDRIIVHTNDAELPEISVDVIAGKQ